MIFAACSSQTYLRCSLFQVARSDLLRVLWTFSTLASSVISPQTATFAQQPVSSFTWEKRRPCNIASVLSFMDSRARTQERAEVTAAKWWGREVWLCGCAQWTRWRWEWSGNVRKLGNGNGCWAVGLGAMVSSWCAGLGTWRTSNSAHCLMLLKLNMWIGAPLWTFITVPFTNIVMITAMEYTH